MSKATQSTDGVYSSFHNIVSFARDLNTQLLVPEVVFIGKQGHGKTSLVEAFFGHPFSVVSKEKGGCTKRAVSISMINNPACDKPKVTIKRDIALKEFTDDKVVPIESLEKEISARNVISPSPIFIQYEFKNCWNVTVIDTPGLVGSSDKNNSEISADEIEEMVLDMCKPSNRILVFVEEVKDGGQSEMMLLAKKADPRFDRTIFVFTKFADQLKNFTTTRDLNRYLSSTAASEAPSFFVSLVPVAERTKYPTKETYKPRLDDLVKQDMTSLEQLQYDRRYAGSIGVVALKKHLMELTYNKYQANIPELLKKLRVMKKKSEESLSHIQQQFKATDNNRLRGAAAKYVMQFLQCIEKLLSGTLEGNPTINGQTLEEEKSQDETGEWRDVSHAVIEVDPADYKIPHAGSKLYGGQQFERLLAEFKAVVDHISMNKLNSDDIATAAGPQKLNSASSCTWAASDIAQRQIQRALLPLIDQLFVRSTYIMKRLVSVAEGMMDNAKKSKRRGATVAAGASDVEELDQYPYFTYAVKDLYYKFVDATAEECKRKCKDEFFCTRLIHWELTNLDGKTINFPKGDKEDIRKAVVSLANELFDKIRDRIAKSVLLKSYNFFLVPLQSEVWSEIQGNITSLSDDQLQELFEVAVTRQRLTDAEKDMHGILGKFVEQENLFLDYANGFSKLTPKEVDF
eukprot:TRINITY_DN1204_c0_g1_i2.p1 TRINITY_DN1204_c0_g1~~TRINITY_DN1204_c0_g1_i2.p1  ORF type:complete len:686 (-),score=244.80 TRINITY_DN1204_c0_g1_i2:48-2105(-)